LSVGHLVEAAVGGALRGRPVIADDVEDQRVIEDTEIIDRVDDATDFVVSLFEEAGVDLHLPGQNWLEFGRHGVPGGNLGMAFGQLGIVGYHAQLLLSAKDLFPQGIPPAVELPLVLVRPFLGYMVRRMRRSRREVHEKGFVRSQRLLLAHPGNGVVREVLGERVALLW
jgi:hypothetical protein